MEQSTQWPLLHVGLEKEALALVLGVKHFHQYLYSSVYNCHQSSTLDLPAGSSKANSFTGLGSFAAVGLLTAHQYRIKFHATTLPQKEWEFTVEGKCLLWGTQVVVLRKLQNRVRVRVASGCTNSIARSYIWWPGMDTNIEELVVACEICRSVKCAPLVAPMHPWVWPEKPWQRVHADFAGPFCGWIILLLVDAHSKWPEMVELSSTTSERTINALRSLFAVYGLPEQLVTDNGPQFTSTELGEFTQQSGIKHIYMAPYHPFSNGAVERFVQTFKQAMKAGERSGVSVQHTLQSFLLSYQSRPRTTTGHSPVELFLKRTLRTWYDLWTPNVGTRVHAQQANQKEGHDVHARVHNFEAGTQMLATEDVRDSSWNLGIVVAGYRPLLFVVKLKSGQTVRRHIHHLKKLRSIRDDQKEETCMDSRLAMETSLPTTPLPDPPIPSLPKSDSPQSFSRTEVSIPQGDCA